MEERQVVDYRGIEVVWRPELDGGGREFGQDFLPVVAHLFGRVRRVFEFCAGPGFIGFSLLAHGLCESLALGDINPRAVEVMSETVRRNRLGDRVDVYLSDGLAGIPSGERWDLVVGNPPHFGLQQGSRPDLIGDDPGWRLHRDFYREVGGFLAPGGSVLLQENSRGSRSEEFLPLLAEGDLEHVRTLWYCRGRGGPTFYFMWSMPRLPGLTAEDGVPERVAIGLGGRPASRQALVGDRIYQVELSNRSGKLLWLCLLDEAGNDLEWLRLELPRDACIDLPRFALRPGSYRVHDVIAGEDLVHLEVAG